MSYEVDVVFKTRIAVKAASEEEADAAAWVWAQRVCDVGNIEYEGSDEEITALETKIDDVEILGKVADDAH